MKIRFFKHFLTTLSGILGGAAAGAALAVQQQGPTKGAAISGAIMGGAAGFIGALGGASKDPGKGTEAQ